jgi:hypothetical protein
MKAAHLVRRFFRALWPGPPGSDAAVWVEQILTPSELALWRQLPNHDRRYSIGVARRVEHTLVGTEYAGDPRWLAAALLHDTGKLDSGLGVVGRSLATIAAALAGRSRVDQWRSASGWRGRVATYVQHDELGARRIRDAGGRPEAAEWAWAHHHADRRAASGIPEVVAEALRAADDA